jgi:hypothetical protein
VFFLSSALEVSVKESIGFIDQLPVETLFAAP